MNEPKYLLVFEVKYHENPYVIYEQAEIGGKIGQRVYRMFGHFEDAMYEMNKLNDGEPVLLAYSTKPIDNTFDLNRG